MEPSLSAVLIDDEATARTTLRRMLQRYCPEVSVVGEGHDVVSGAKIIQRTKPAIVFLDIRFGRESGFDLLDVLGDVDFSLVFVTAYDEYAIQAFKFNAIDYLLKPIDPEELVAVVEKIRNISYEQQLRSRLASLRPSLSGGPSNRLVINNEEGYFFLSFDGIIRLESIGRGITCFHCSDRDNILVTKTIGDYEVLLPNPPFFRVHQSHIINLHQVDSYRFEDGGFILMRDQTKLPLARRRKDGFLDAIRNLQ